MVRMRLRIVTTRGVALDAVVERVVAESVDGSFTLLPRHLDVVAPLATGLLRYRGRPSDAEVTADDTGHEEPEHVVAVDGGMLVKQGGLVSVATRWVVRADSTDELERALHSMTAGLDEHERASRAALGRLEHDLVARLAEIGEDR